LEKILSDFRDRKANLLLGTQMLVKGHDFPGVTLVVVVLADALFRWPDFRASERALQTLTQVSGRAGRGGEAGRVLIQTFQPEHAVIQVLTHAVAEDQFIEAERELRQALRYPPFGRLARLRFEASSRELCRQHAESCAAGLRRVINPSEVELLGPSEAFLERAKGIYRWDLLLKATSVLPLQRAVLRAKEFAGGEKWGILVDVDPYGVG
jgi:primosomal protein N' (replication factor Y)